MAAPNRSLPPSCDTAESRAVCNEMSASCAGMQRQGSSADEACKNFWIADYNGLITVEREDLSDAVAPFARSPGAGDSEGEALADIVRRVSASLSKQHVCRSGSAG